MKNKEKTYEIEYEFEIETPCGTQDYLSGDYADWQKETKVYTYEIEKDDLSGCFLKILKDSDYDKFMQDDFDDYDEFFEKYYEQIKYYFENRARDYFEC